MLVLNGEFIEEHLDTARALQLARRAMELTVGGGQKTPLRNVMALPTGNGLMGCMPGWIGSPDRFGIKLVNIFPGNTAAGLSSQLANYLNSAGGLQTGAGTSTASPGASRAHIRCENPSFAPIVLITSVSGSRSTSQVRLYRSARARRSLGMPRLAE